MSTVTEHSPLPSRHSVRVLIEDLIGRDIELRDTQPVGPRTTNVIAVYVTDKLATAAIAVVTLEAAARLGGALGMVPRGGVEDAIAGRDLPNLIRDCTYEVLNVLSSVFNVAGAPHVRLYEMYGPNGVVPGDVAAMVGMIGQRMDVALKIAGYGDGSLSLIVR
jgi:hypothetical protein